MSGVLSTADPYVTVLTGTASYGDIPAGATATHSPLYQFTTRPDTPYSHPILFTLAVTANGGAYTTTLPFTITIRSADEHFCGTIAEDMVWTNDKTYILDCNVGIAPGYTLTIQAGTVVRVNGNWNLNVGGTLIADGTAAQPIRFMPHTPGGTWGRILFDDPSTDAQATDDGVYLSGNLLRHVRIEGASQGIACTNATPYLDHVTLTGGGMNCALGDTVLWVQGSDLKGNVQISAGNGVDVLILRNTIRGDLSLPSNSSVLTSTVRGSISAGGNSKVQNTNIIGGISISGSGIVQNNTVKGSVTLNSGIVQNNAVSGSIALSSGSVLTNTVRHGGISLGNGMVRGNNVENAPGWGIQASGNAIIEHNRVVGCASGIRVSSGTVRENLIAHIAGVGLELGGSGTVERNTLTVISASAVRITAGTAITLTGNNFEFNTGAYYVEDLVPNTTLPTVDARNNWWGTTSSAVIQQRIWDFNDDYSLGTVLYSPVLTEPSALAPAYVRAITLTPESPVGIQTVAFDVLFSREMNPEGAPELSFAGTEVWALRTLMPTARGYLAAVVGRDGKIYAIGGYNYVSGPMATVEAYDPAADTWTLRAPMPTAREGLAAVAGPDGKIYAIGGYGRDGITLATVEVYDPATDTWTLGTSMPTARRGLAAVVGLDGKIYAIGGYTPFSGALATVEAYDPATDTWTPRAPMPTARWLLAAVVGPDGKIYAIGGYDDISSLATVEVYDPATDTWTPGTPMSTARRGLVAVVGPDSKIYAIGGYNLLNGHLAMVEVYDPATDTWTTRTPMPTARSMLAAVTGPNGKIYAIGGFNSVNDGSYLATVEELTPSLAHKDFYGGNWPAPNRYRAFYDFSTLVPRGTYTLTVQGALGADGIQIAPHSAITFTVDYAGAINDTTPPPAPTVIACATAAPDTLSARWSASDPESTIDRYQYAIGLTPSGAEVVNWTFTSLTETTRTGLILTAGQTYYVSVKARNEGGLWSVAGSVGVVAGSGKCNSNIRQVFLPLVLRNR